MSTLALESATWSTRSSTTCMAGWSPTKVTPLVRKADEARLRSDRARSITSAPSWSWNGRGMKSSAPMRKAETISRTVALAMRATTGIGLFRACAVASRLRMASAGNPSETTHKIEGLS
jgi:hypothetical protein